MTNLFNKDIHEFYNCIDEDARLKRSNANHIEFLTTTKYINRLVEPQSTILDACAGTGIYAIHLSENGHRVTAGDLVGKKCTKTNHVTDFRTSKFICKVCCRHFNYCDIISVAINFSQ